MSLTYPKPASYVGDQLAAEIGPGVTVQEVGDSIEVVGTEDSAAVEAALTAHVPIPDYVPPGPAKDWRDKLRAEVAFIDEQIATWPPDATTNTQALQRVNFLLAATKRIARNQARILRFIDTATMDSGV